MKELAMKSARRIRLAAGLGLAACILVASPVAASGPPPNDDLANATVISSLPYQIQEDTSGATIAASDPLDCLSAQDTYTRTVWYTYRATATEPLKLAVLSTGTAAYGFAVVDVTDGGFALVGCSTSGDLQVDVRAGRTYAAMTAVPTSQADRTDSLFVLEVYMQRHVPFTFEPGAARPGDTVTVLANVKDPSEVPCYPIDATLLFSPNSAVIERDDRAVSYARPSDESGLFNPLIRSSSGLVFNPPVPFVQRWVLPEITAGTYATYWQCNEPFLGPEVWRASDFTVLPRELPPTDLERAPALPNDPPGGSGEPALVLGGTFVVALVISGWRGRSRSTGDSTGGTRLPRA